jgi:hypothetical protein
MKRRRKIFEAPIDYEGPERMSPDIERKLSTGEHPLGKHQAFPESGGGDSFEEVIASKRFKDVIEKVKRATGLETVDPASAMSIQPMMQQALMRAMQIESQHKQALEQLAIEVVMDNLAVPEGDLQFDAQLKKPTLEGMQNKPQKPKNKPQIPQNPEEEQEAADRLQKLDLERQKRRFINSLIQGSSKKALYLYHMVDEKLNEIDPDLVNLYSLLMSVNDLMYWIMPDMDMRMAAGEGESLGAGREELDLETDPPTIKAEGALFPILVHELFKGVMEYVSAHGLPSDPDFAEDVIGMEDTLPAEIWDLRLGPVIWEKFMEAYPQELITNDDSRRIQNYLYFRIVSLEAEEFLNLAKKMLEGGEEGKRLVQKLVDEIVQELKEEDYEEAVGIDTNDDDILSIDGNDKPESTESEELDVDTILDKISRSGMDSLTNSEKQFLTSLGD